MKVKTLVKNLKKKKFENANILISLGDGKNIVADKIIYKNTGIILISIK